MGDEEESLADRQENEVEALKAIYDKDFEDLREKDVWKVRRAPEFILKVRANHDSQGQSLNSSCSVDLRIKLPENYPLAPPVLIDPINSKGLSTDHVKELKSLLKKTASEKVGEVMIHEIAMQVSSWLDSQSKNGVSQTENPIKGFASFHEAMEARTKADLERRKEEGLRKVREKNVALTSKEKDAIREEVFQKKEALKEEKLLRKEEEKRRYCGNNDFLTSLGISDPVANRRARIRRLSQTVSESSDSMAGQSPVEGIYKDIKSVVFQTKVGSVYVISQIGHNVLGGVVYIGIIKTTGKLVSIAEWNFRTRKINKKSVSFDAESANIHDENVVIKQIASIEQELLSIQKLSHVNIVPYITMTTENHPSVLTVRVFSEYVNGSNFAHYLTENLSVDLSALRHYVTDILEALTFMHQHNFVHRDIRETSIFLESSGRVRLGDFSIDKRIRDIITESKEEFEKYPLAIGRGGKKGDIFRLGVLTLSLAQGEVCQDVLIPKSFPPDFVNFLKNCLMKDERERWSADQLLEHSWIKTPIATSLKQSDFDQTSEAFEDEEPVQPMPYSYSSGQSRLQSEFSYMGEIGKGGFGEVIKVKNKLDSQVYAIKRIRLDPNNRQLTKKIMREVKLLSRLNHENVVRYYNSWIEVTSQSKDCKDSDEDEVDSHSFEVANKIKGDGFSAKLDTEIENYGPNFPSETVPADLSLSFSAYNFHDDHDLSRSESDSEDDDAIFGTSFFPSRSCSDSDSEIIFEEGSDGSEEDESDNIVFNQSDSNLRKSESSKKVSSKGSDIISLPKKAELHFMYIQMELCDKQTLKTAIDDGLYENIERVWRLFREIIEGLFHIHTQGMIHRDLKPTNIFLDSNDQVKIGDFGLATANLMSGKYSAPNEDANHVMNVSLNESSFDVDMTSQVGTALYVAPEMNLGRSTATYNQKVDLYSLGIIFFEMCCPPLKTGMERVKILNGLRSKEIVIPDDLASITVQQSYIIKWLLNHDPGLRPSSADLLKSDYLPPVNVVETKVNEIVRHTIVNKKGSLYRNIVQACMDQKMTDGADIAFDTDIHFGQTQRKAFFKHEYAKKIVQRIFELHGAVLLQAPQLLPHSSLRLYNRTDKLVLGMTKGGDVVCLPFDLRATFARFIARAKISNLRRYNIATVFREKAVHGVQPKELTECAFDIVTPSEGSLIADAEVLCVIDKILQRFQSIKDVKFSFRINHLSLLRGILLHFGISEEEHQNVFNLILDGERWSKQQRVIHLVNMGIAESTVSKLLTILEKEGSIELLGGILKQILKRKTQASSDIKQGLNELEVILANASAMGIKTDVVIAPSLIFHPDYFKGMVCQLVRKKNRGGQDILAVGGRYDHLIAEFAEKFSLVDDYSNEPAQCAVGISLSLDRLASLVTQEEMVTKYSSTDVIVCSQVHHESLVRKKLELAKNFWMLGIRCFVSDIHLSVDDVVEVGLECGASYVVILHDSDAPAKLKIMTDKEKVVDRRLPVSEIIEFLQKQLIRPSSDQPDSNSLIAVRADSVIRQIESRSANPSIQLSFIYKFVDKKALNYKKKLESYMANKLMPHLSLFFNGNFVEVIVLSLAGAVIRTIVAYLELEDENKFGESVSQVIERIPKHKKDVAAICEEIRVSKFERIVFGLVLYSCEDHVFKIIV